MGDTDFELDVPVRKISAEIIRSAGLHDEYDGCPGRRRERAEERPRAAEQQRQQQAELIRDGRH